MSYPALQLNPHYSFETWLIDERVHPERTEYIVGEVFAMTGASVAHNLIVTNIVCELSLQMKGRPCCVYASDLKVRITDANACCYPDVLVICGDPQFHDQRHDVVLNPTLIVEVLSKSTEAYDRGDKFALYRNLKSLCTYLLIAQHRIYAELYVRSDNGRWSVNYYDGLDKIIAIASPQCIVKLEEVYDKVEIS